MTATLFLIIALILFALSAFGVAIKDRSLIAAGLAFLTAAMLVGARVLG